MELTEQQKAAVRDWVEQGAELADVQRRLADEFGITMTYMDVRLLVLDLDVQLKDKADEQPEESDEAEGATVPTDTPESAAAVADGTVKVELDALVRPGAIVSGSVIFSDGVSAAWMLDQLGRLALEPSQSGYQPSQEDQAEFMQALKAALAAKGF